MSFDAQEYLAAFADVAEDDIDLSKAALALAARAQPGVHLEKYVNHIRSLGEDVAAHHAELLRAGAKDDVGARLAALKHVIVTMNGYSGDTENYNDLQNASLIRVIERRKGLPVTLALLYIAAGRANGWDVVGLDFPGHFLCRIEKDGKRIIFDPFYDCRVHEAPGLRDLIKQAKGKNAELSADYFLPASNRDILIRLQNNIKFRQIESEDYSGALQTVEGMRLIDPKEYRLLLDAGVLYARTGQTRAAIAALEDYIKTAPKSRDRHEAALLLQELKNSLQ